MGFRIDEMAGGVIVRIDGTRLDAAQAIHFKDRLRQIVVQHGPLILLDLGQVDFMDSSGLGAILAIRRILPETHRIELAALRPNVERVFRLTHMDSIFVIHDSPPAACADAAQPQPDHRGASPGS